MGTRFNHIEALIFDLDGVLVDTAVFHFMSWGRLAKELGFSLKDEDNEELKGVSRMKALDIVLKKGNVEADEERRIELATRKNDWYREYIREMKPEDVLPGVREYLESMVARNVPLAVASASKNAPTILEQCDLRKYFKSMVDGNRTTKAKPDPEVFLLAASELGVAPENCAVFEDAIAGVEGALAGGMTAIGIGEPENLHHAHLVIPSIAAVDPQLFSFEKISLT